jgi:hypothetical protein
MKPEKDRVAAATLFVRDGKSCTQIAPLVGANRQTIWRWCRDGKWMEHRREHRRLSPLNSLEILKRQRDMHITAVDVKTPITPDAVTALVKLNQAIEKLEAPQDEVGIMLAAFGRFAEFVAARADEAARAVLGEWIEKFLDEERRKGS